nr:RDD family protein [bacterium]
QIGPLNENEFAELIASKTIIGDTYVWRDGMKDWQKFKDIENEFRQSEQNKTYSSAQSETKNESPSGQSTYSENLITCSECQNSFKEDDIVYFGETSVCVNCKEFYVQKTKEGAHTSKIYSYAGFWIRFAAKFIDSIIIYAANFISILIIGFCSAFLGNPIVVVATFLVSIIVPFVYSVFFLSKYSATPGKMACGLKVICVNENSISKKKAFFRYLSETLSALTLCIGYIIAAFDNEKRTLHDRLCNTRVIKNG